MRRVDQETYIGPCRRVAQRPRLRHRRRVDRAHASPPSLQSLFAQGVLAHRLGIADQPRWRLRIRAALDLADRLGDSRMATAFQALDAATRVFEGPEFVQ
jgi:hypothetical protein